MNPSRNSVKTQSINRLEIVNGNENKKENKMADSFHFRVQRRGNPIRSEPRNLVTSALAEQRKKKMKIKEKLPTKDTQKK